MLKIVFSRVAKFNLSGKATIVAFAYQKEMMKFMPPKI